MRDLHQDQMHLNGLDPLQGKKLFVRKRDGRIEEFNEARILLAIESAFKANEGINRDLKLPLHFQAFAKKCADAVVEQVLARAVRGEQLEVEKIQDAVEERLMLNGHLAVARRYILYREKRRMARAANENRGPMASPASPSKTPARAEIIAPRASKGKKTADPAEGLRQEIYLQALGSFSGAEELHSLHRQQFGACVARGQYLQHFSPELLNFDLETLASSLRLERDQLLPQSGLQALQADYLLREQDRILETPQYFWMRLAMGLALNEGLSCNERALEFYEALSTLRFVPSDAILSHAGTNWLRLVDCEETAGWGDLEHARALPGPRAEHRSPGQTCSWIEPWHAGVRDFLKPAPVSEQAGGQNMNKGLWIPDLFMKRVIQKGHWTLFDTAQVPGLHQLFGRTFDQRYLEYEALAAQGQMPGAQQIEAASLWQEIISALAATGQPWLGFKDAINVRSTQSHNGVIRHASLNTALLLNTSSQDAFSCAQGSINLAAHLPRDQTSTLDLAQLRRTVVTALRMLDNALELSVYPSASHQHTAQEHRPVALGLMGFQDVLDQRETPHDSAAAAVLADWSMEIISHSALLASAALARERGAYPDFPGSKWSLGFLPIDTLGMLEAERGMAVDVDLSTTQDWEMVRAAIQASGLRHCTTTAISAMDNASRITGASSAADPSAREQISPNRTVFELGPQWLVECAARRQKWLDMSQALNLYLTETSVEVLADIYLQAWEKGLKTTRELYSPARLPLESAAAIAAPRPTPPGKVSASTRTTPSARMD